MVKLRVSVGGSYTDLAIVNCNDELHPIEFDGPEFQGRAIVRIKDFAGITNDGSKPVHDSDYFKGHNRRFSLQVEGRFKREWDGEQVYFGTDFERGVDLPDGFEMMLKIARYIDPVVRTSLTKNGKPWILSPLVSSINTMAAWRPQDANLPSPPMSPRQSTDMSHGLLNESHSSNNMWGFLGKFKKRNKRSSVHSEVPVETQQDEVTEALGHWRQHLDEDTTFFMPQQPSMSTPQRRKYFQSEQHRKEFVFRTDLVHGFEFFSPHMDFNTFDIRMGLSMNIRKYLAGQPVRYTCRTLGGETVFWAVQFELVD
ncbi:MAG: hypothetical protein BYD32DRAFT_401734 [Podila humilis]|nr:MAG: hypothetical protein BYD32DRAFT_401734 [Podila humilis]